jgi:hypothetical protein
MTKAPDCSGAFHGGEWVKRPICLMTLKTQGFVISETLSTPFFCAIASWQAEEQGL